MSQTAANPITVFFNHLAFQRSLKSFHPKCRMKLEKGEYVVKTAESWDELQQVLKLRYRVFHLEYRNKRFPFGMDIEALDAVADHLMIVRRDTGTLVGTYRLISSNFSKQFYSQTEFAIEPFFK